MNMSSYQFMNCYQQSQAQQQQGRAVTSPVDPLQTGNSPGAGGGAGGGGASAADYYGQAGQGGGGGGGGGGGLMKRKKPDCTCVRVVRSCVRFLPLVFYFTLRVLCASVCST